MRVLGGNEDNTMVIVEMSPDEFNEMLQNKSSKKKDVENK